MNDLLRSYKMILKRRQSIDSEESQPLMSSHSSSTASFGAFHDQCMFNNESETTETEAERSNRQQQAALQTQSATAVSPRSVLRRPFCFPGEFHAPVLDLFTTNDNVSERYQYLRKFSGALPDNSLIHTKLASLAYENSDPPLRTQNSLVTIFAVWNTIMGSSLLAMAWGLEKSGLIPGIFLHILIAGICTYTAYVILKINENYGDFGRAKEVPDLCRLLLGKWAETVAKIFSLIVLIGSNIVYWILMSNFLYNSVHFIFGYLLSTADDQRENGTVICPKHHFINATFSNTSALQQTPLALESAFDRFWNLYGTVPPFLGVLMFPLLNFKSPTFFTKFNSLGTLSAMYLLIFVSVKSYSWGLHMPDWPTLITLKTSFCALSGMLSLSYFIHNIIISVMRNNRRQDKNGRDLCIAYGLVVFTYVFVGVALYVSFPLAKSCIEDNILNNFPKYDPMTLIARLLLLFQLFTVFPLMTFMLRVDILTNFGRIFGGACADASYAKVVFVNLVVVLICIFFACFLPRIGTLIRYTGALSGMIYVFTLPSLLKIAALRSEKSLTACSYIIHMLIIVMGVLNLISQFFIADR